MPMRSAVGAGLAADETEVVLLDQVEQRDRALVLDLGRAARDRLLVEHDVDDAPRLVGSAPASACAAVQPDRDRAAVRAQPLGLGQRQAAGPRAASDCGVQATSEVRFRKSETPRPPEKRAAREVGSTWLVPAT